MGLDMYLTRKRFLWTKEREKLKISGIEGINIKKVSEITEEVFYWRKVNAIHRWFVMNVQKGEDDCKEHYVSKDDLKKLLALIETVLEHKGEAEKLLPTQKGFFFGNDKYDAYYFEELERTAKELRKILKRKDTDWSYHYNSSW